MQKQPAISNLLPIYPYLQQLKDKTLESCIFIALNNKNKIIAEFELYSKEKDQIAISIRSLLYTVILPETEKLLLFHNHPSGSVYPSLADFRSTQQLVEIGRFLSFTLADHIILTKSDYFSFAEAGIIEGVKIRSA